MKLMETPTLEKKKKLEKRGNEETKEEGILLEWQLLPVRTPVTDGTVAKSGFWNAKRVFEKIEHTHRVCG